MTHSRRAGSALVISLLFLVLITLLTVGFFAEVRIERGSARSYLEGERSANFARMGVDATIGAMASTTGIPSESAGPFWISMPGQLIVSENQSGKEILASPVDLYSGVPSAALLDPGFEPAYLRPAELNVQTLSDQSPPTHLITDEASAGSAAPPRLLLSWIYVRNDGSFDRSEIPDLTDKTNPIVGRFAFWTDDESTKINYNLAWKRAGDAGVPSSFETNHPSNLNLLALNDLTSVEADLIQQQITPGHDYSVINRFFNSPQDIRQLGPAISRIVDENKLSVTHFNHSPTTTFFNQPRIVLTTQAKHAAGRPFLDILKNPGTASTLGGDPGTLGQIDYAKVDKVLRGDPGDATRYPGLLNYLETDKWPITAPGSDGSLQSKYFEDNPDRLAQLALNILDYVRSAESTKPIVEPLRIYRPPGADDSQPFTNGESRGGEDGSYQGRTRAPAITELAIWRSDTPQDGRYKVRNFVELHLPADYGFDELNLLEPEPGRKFNLFITEVNNRTYYSTSTSATTTHEDNGNSAWMEIKAENILGGGPIMQPGEYRTIVHEFYRNNSSRDFTMRTVLTVAPASQGGARIDIAPLSATSAYTLRLTSQNGIPDSPGAVPAGLSSVETDDPRVNASKQDWTPQIGTNTLGQRNNANSVGKPPTVAADQPQQDTDAAGLISDASLRMPYPRGHQRNPDGIVYSTGELGFIHTGLEGRGNIATGGVPWRTLRLQPNRSPDTSEVPDWAFIDLFSAPIEIPAAATNFFFPHERSSAGPVNLNARPVPFGDNELVSDPAEQISRVTPIAATLQGALKPGGGTYSADEARTIAGNIVDLKLANLGKRYGYPDAYDSPGEVVEIEGVADGGEASESTFRAIANLITARSGVFTAYSVGQSLKQTPIGSLEILGEQRLQAMIERYEVDLTTGTEVRYRTIYYRNLIP